MYIDLVDKKKKVHIESDAVVVFDSFSDVGIDLEDRVLIFLKTWLIDTFKMRYTKTLLVQKT